MKRKDEPAAVRRIDDLGRIVIPREIRTLLRLREGDSMEIAMAGNRIIMEKHQPGRYWAELCGPYLSAFGRSSGAVCAVCSQEHILSASAMDIPEGALLSTALRERISTLNPYQYDEKSRIPLLEDERYIVDTLYPAGTERLSLAGVALLQGHTVTDKDRQCARLLADIITENIRKEG